MKPTITTPRAGAATHRVVPGAFCTVSAPDGNRGPKETELQPGYAKDKHRRADAGYGLVRQSPAPVPNDGPVLQGVARVRQSRAQTKAFYDRISAFYDLLARRTEQPARNAGLALLAARPGETLLEIGPGTGHTLVSLAVSVGATGAVHGIDISEKMLARSRKLIRRNAVGDRVTITKGDAAQLPYATASMDGVFMSFVLELFDTPEIPAVLAECRRVLRPGGRLVVVGLSKQERPGLVANALEWLHRHLPSVIDCRSIPVRRVVQDAGFHVAASSLLRQWVPVEVVLAKTPGANESSGKSVV